MADALKPGDRIAVTHQCRTPEGVEYEHTVPVDIVEVDSEDPLSYLVNLCSGRQVIVEARGQR